MTQYLTPRQRQLFIDRLAEENDAPQLSGDQRRAALQQGANMARADMQGLPDEEGERPARRERVGRERRDGRASGGAGL